MNQSIRGPAANDLHNLQRFLDAQQSVFGDACDQLTAGRKTSHWIWFIFPQYSGLGHSAMAQRYAIGSMDEAHAYLAHPVLGDRLKTCVDLMLQHHRKSAIAILGTPDDLKFHSCLTLFNAAQADEALFKEALHVFFAGRRDSTTLDLIGKV